MERQADIVKQLREALANNDADRTARLIADDYQDLEGNTALHLAAAMGDVELLTRLLALPDLPDVNVVNRRGETPLIHALKCLYKSHNAAPNNNADGDDNNGSILSRIVQLLVQAGVDLVGEDSLGHCAFDYCLENEDLKTARELWPSFGDDDDDKDNDDLGMTWQEVPKTFYFDDFNPDEFERQHLNKGQTLSEYRDNVRVEQLLHLSALTSNLAYTRYFLEHGYNVNASANGSGDTPLIRASWSMRRKFKSSVIKLLLEAGADVKAANCSRGSALHCCAHYTYGDVESVQLLIDAGIDIDHRTLKNGMRTPLLVASEVGNIPVMRYLLERGADPQLCDARGLDPLVVAIKKLYRIKAESSAEEQERIDILKLLLKSGAEASIAAFALVLKLGDKRTVRLFLEYGADLQFIDDQERVGLHFAAMNDDLAVLELVLNASAGGRSRGIDRKCKFGLTALHYAAENFRHENIQLLCELGADVNATAENGNTPLLQLLQEAVHPANTDLNEKQMLMSITLLVQWGANLGVTNAEGKTVISIASAHISLSPLIMMHKILDDVVRHGLNPNDKESINGFWEIFLSNNPLNDEGTDLLKNLWRQRIFFDNCLRELVAMQRHEFHGSVTLFDLLACDRKKFAKLVRHQKYGQTFYEYLPQIMESSWPFYRSLLCSRFKRALQEQSWLNRARATLRGCLPVSLGDLILDAILKGLTTRELKRLIGE